ncbi:MAG: SRPBCC family protein [Erythrobacter sp.]
MVIRLLARPFATLAGCALLIPAPTAAEVVDIAEARFTTRDEAVVAADTKATWLALISPSRWWSDEHTWSADAANLSLTPQAGGCFCETIPEVEDNDRITLEGSAEHMRVVQAYPEVALRMVGALGPLQSEPVTGVLTITLTEVDEGTQIVWEYNVGGPMRYDVETIARAVDGVMTQQLAGLAQLLGRSDSEGPRLEPLRDDETEPDPLTEADEPAVGEDEADGSAIDDAFGDFAED